MTAPWLRLLAAAVALLVGLLLGAWWPIAPVPLLAGAGVSAALAVILPRRWRGLMLVTAIACVGMARAEADRHIPSPSTVDYYQGSAAVLRGWIDEPPEVRRGAVRLYLSCSRLVTPDQPERAVRGRLQLTLHGGGTSLAYGDRVEAQGTVVPIHSSDRFDYADYLGRSDIWASLANPSLRRVGAGAGNPVYGILLTVKGHFLNAVRAALPEPQAALVLGIVLGYRSALPAELETALVETGLIHIVVISGLKVAITAGIMQRLCHRLVPRLAAPLALAGVAGYVVMAGASAAAVRAGVMGSAAVLAGALRRDSYAALSLALTAAAMLLIRPSLLRDVSFQLSFLGTAGIILLTPAVEARVPFLPTIVREPFALTIAAQAATLPIMAQNFGVVSLVGPVANALVLPALPAVILAGGGGGLLGSLAAAAGYLPLQAAGWVCVYIAAVVHLLGSVPLAAAPAPTFPLALAAGYYLSLGGALAGYRLRAWCSQPLLWAGLAVGAVAIVVLFLARPDGRLQVVALDVGTGAAVLVQGPGGEHLLLNGGGDADRLQQSLGRVLPPGARTLHAVVVSGGSRSEVAGLAEIFSRFRVERLYLPDGPHPYSVRQLEKAAQGRRVPVQVVQPGQVITVSGVALTPVTQGDSLGWAVRLGRRTVLILPPTLAPDDLPALAPDAVILGAGGPDRVPPGWLARPVTVVVQVGRQSRDGLPARALMRQLAEVPAVRVLRTDQAGNITFSTDGRDFRVRP